MSLHPENVLEFELLDLTVWWLSLVQLDWSLLVVGYEDRLILPEPFALDDCPIQHLPVRCLSVESGTWSMVIDDLSMKRFEELFLCLAMFDQNDTCVAIARCAWKCGMLVALSEKMGPI